MVRANILEKGDFVEIDNDALKVIEHEFVKPGKGAAFVRLKLKSCLNGAVHKNTYPSEMEIATAEIVTTPFQFLYPTQDEYCCMNTESYEQFTIEIGAHKEKGDYMQEGADYIAVLWNGKIIDIELPLKVAYEVLEAQEAIRGNTVSGGTKSVSIQNGMQIKVPLFIEKGDKILINTSTGKYIERVS